MTTRRSFFGWLAGAAAAPAVAQEAIANSGSRDLFLRLNGFHVGGPLRGLVKVEGRPLDADRLARIQEALERHRFREEFAASVPSPIRAPRHFIRARVVRLRGMPEHVARNKRPRRREA
jgi:hypothetical protein